MAMNVITTSDGGVLMHATSNDLYDNLRQLDIHLIKVDSAGNTTWAKNIALEKKFIKVYPNPANEYIGLLLPENFEYPANLEVYSMDGKLVMKKEIKYLNTIPIKNIENGIYQLKITNSNQAIYTQKLIIE